MTMATITALIDTHARVLNTLRTWGSVRTGMRCTALLDSADVDYNPIIALGELNLIAAQDGGGNQIPIVGTDEHRIRRCQIKLTAAGRQWVESPPNMLLRELDLAGRAGLGLRKAMQIANDTQIIRWAVDEEGYATLHARSNDVELRGFSRKGIEFQTPHGFILRPTYKIRKRVGA